MASCSPALDCEWEHSRSKLRTGIRKAGKGSLGRFCASDKLISPFPIEMYSCGIKFPPDITGIQ